jgi:hypothetical protein
MPVLQEQKPVIDARRSAGDWHCPSSSALRLLPLPRLEGVTCIRYLLLGANTPWNRVRLTRGLGTNAASRARKSNGSKMTPLILSNDNTTKVGCRLNGRARYTTQVISTSGKAAFLS